MDMFGNDDQGENSPSLSSCNSIFHAPNVSTVLPVIELDHLGCAMLTGRSYLEGKLWRAGQSACCLSSDRLESVAQSSLKQKNMWEQLKSGKLHTNLCTLNNCVADFVFHHRLVGIYIEAFGAGKGEEDCTY